MQLTHIQTLCLNLELGQIAPQRVKYLLEFDKYLLEWVHVLEIASDALFLTVASNANRPTRF